MKSQMLDSRKQYPLPEQELICQTKCNRMGECGQQKSDRLYLIRKDRVYRLAKHSRFGARLVRHEVREERGSNAEPLWGNCQARIQRYGMH